jgi:hypothetical protein
MSKFLTAIISASLKAVYHSVLVAQTIIIGILLVNLICAILYFTVLKLSHERGLSQFFVLRCQIAITFLEIVFNNVFVKSCFLIVIDHVFILLTFR